MPLTLIFLGSFFGLFAQEDARFVVVLDAGHGGKDPGKVSGGVKEKDIALKLVLLIGKRLEKQGDIKVVYTRNKDVFIDLFVRGKIANKADADLFVSIHCNAFKNPKTHGSETFVLGLHANRANFEIAKSENEVIYMEDDYLENYEAYDINSPESIIGLTISQEEFLRQSVELASFIQESLTEESRRANRGVKQAGFIVLHQTFMPSVLVETGFVTNSSERRYLNSFSGQNRIANNIADAIIRYKGVYAVKQESEYFKEITSDEVVFRIQLAVSKKRIEPKSYNFKGLNQITRQKYKGDYYRYLYGKTNSYMEAVKLKEQAIESGYADCYVVAFRDGEKVSIREALEIQER